MKLKLSFIILIIGSCLILSNAYSSAAVVPSLSDSPEPVDYHHWEIYLYSNMDKNPVLLDEPDLQTPVLEIDWGIFPNTELHLEIPYAWSIPSTMPSTNGLGDIELGIKYRFLQETENRPQIGIAPLFELPTGNENLNLGNGQLWLKLPVWAQKSWGPWTAYCGGGYAINPAPEMRNYPYFGFLIEKDLSKQVTLSAEIFSQGAMSDASAPFTLFNLGSSYSLTQNCRLLFNVGHSMIGENHLVAYTGLYWYW